MVGADRFGRVVERLYEAALGDVSWAAGEALRDRRHPVRTLRRLNNVESLLGPDWLYQGGWISEPSIEHWEGVGVDTAGRVQFLPHHHIRHPRPQSDPTATITLRLNGDLGRCNLVDTSIAVTGRGWDTPSRAVQFQGSDNGLGFGW